MQTAFVEACRHVFRPLVELYGFDQPDSEPIGRETFVRYHRGGHTISVALEPGSRPIVEIYYPAKETGEPPVPWAQRQGVPRAGRIPHLAVAVDYDEDDPSSLVSYLAATATALQQVERDFLARPV